MQAKMMRAKLKKQFAAVFAVEKFFFLPVRGQSAH